MSFSANTKTYVVNMDERADRMKKFDEITPLNYERFSAINGNKLKPNVQLQRIFENNDFNMRAGMVGCAMSHIKICVELVKSDKEMFCILEDDVTFNTAFNDQIKHIFSNFPKNWDLIYLGHHIYPRYKTNTYTAHGLPALEKWDKQKSIQQSIGGTFGYMISKKGARKLLEFINTTGMTNGIDTVQQKAIDVIDTYYCLPHLVFSDCVLPGQLVDSDIQYNQTSLKMPENPTGYTDRLKKDGVFNVDDAVVVKNRPFQFTNTWFNRNINISMKILKGLFLNKPVKVLEIGTHEGRSAIWMLENLCELPGSTFTSVDPYCSDDTTTPVDTETYKRFSHNIKLSTQVDKFDQHIDFSYNIMPKLIEEKKIYDIIYLDGSHLEKDVFYDAEHSHKMLEAGGIILFDDAGSNCGVMPAITAFLVKYSTEYKVLLKEWQMMIQKI
jgi:GR25 family glycosyltransferase involved in LPS biosynthesis/predicted O-methyltransferase YrrM